MNAGQILRASEASALHNNQIISRVTGKKINAKKIKKTKSFGAIGFIIAMLVFFLAIFGSGNIIPSLLSDLLVEETDLQYADAVASKKIILQQALKNGELPNDTTRILKEQGVLVGYLDNNNFIETNTYANGLILKIDNKIITADNFINEINSNPKLYNAFEQATYSRAAYWYDDEAQKVMREIGTSRNNYNNDADFDEVMENSIGSGSNISINSVSLVEKTRINEQTGKEETYYVYEENGNTANSKTDAEDFIDEVRKKNPASSIDESALFSADTLKVADTISKEQRSSLFYLVFMENISKVKAGEGNASKINEAMNYLYENSESEVVDVKTGKIVKTTGTALESPSLYAILSGEKVNTSKVQNYSSDRILKTIENQLEKDGSSAIGGTVTSSTNKIKGSVGRFINNGSEIAPKETLETVSPIISSSLINNSYNTIKGVNAGEFLVEGAINVGKKLAKASGATAGDETAVMDYIKLNNATLAMDAEIDRMNRSPFDITSKNTFLGSIVFNIASISLKNSGTWFAGLMSLGNLISQSLISFLPSSYADSLGGYLTTFGDCETYATANNAVGSAQCSEIAVFDTSTLDDPFNNQGFIDFINNNTTLDNSGSRTINPGSDLAKFILYNKRTAPLGVMDGGILESIQNDSSSVFFTSNILEMIKTWLNASEADKKIATGAIFVNSSQNKDWQTYKYAQRYMSLARATAVLKQNSSDPLAYNNIEFFEGNENPVVAFLEEYYAMNQ